MSFLFPICSRFPSFFVSGIADVIYVLTCVIRAARVIRFVSFCDIRIIMYFIRVMRRACHARVACVIDVIRVIYAAENEKQTQFFAAAPPRHLRLSRRAMISIKAAPFDLKSAFNFPAFLDASSRVRK